MANKRNIDYLRHILDVLGNLMGEKNYKESIEWLDAIQVELDAVRSQRDTFISKNIELESDLSYKEERLSELKELLEGFKNGDGLANQIDTMMGPKEVLYWSCDNLAIESLMNTLGDKLQKHGHIKIENLLNALS